MKSVKELDEAFGEYMRDCFGDPTMVPDIQARELRQAFLAGIMWRDSETLPPGGCESAIRSMLGLGRDRN